MTTTQRRAAARIKHLGPPDEMGVRRDGDLDLVLNGWVLGDGTQGTTQVVIYGTVGGSLVTEIRRAFGPGAADDRHRVAVHKTPKAALDWLRADNRGALGAASKAAWVEACRSWPELKGLEAEQVP